MFSDEYRGVSGTLGAEVLLPDAYLLMTTASRGDSLLTATVVEVMPNAKLSCPNVGSGGLRHTMLPAAPSHMV